MANDPKDVAQAELDSASDSAQDTSALHNQDGVRPGKKPRRSVGREVRQLLAALRMTSSIPAVVEFTAPVKYTVPSDFRLASFTGLLHCTVARTASNDVNVLTYWIDLRSYEAQKVKLLMALGNVTPKWAGDVSEMRLQRPSLLPQSAPDFLLKIAALWGAIVAIGGAWTFLLAPPDMVVTLNPVAMNAVQNGPYEFRAHFTNRAQSGSVQIELRSAETGERIDFVPSPFLTLESGKAAEVSARGSAGRSGARTVRVRLISTGGLLYPRRDEEFKLDLNVWPRESYVRFTVLRKAIDSAIFVGSVRLGDAAPRGLECSAWLNNARDVEFAAVIPAVSFEDPIHNAEPGKEVTSITWKTDPIDQYRNVETSLYLQSKSGAPDWAALASAVEWICERRIS